MNQAKECGRRSGAGVRPAKAAGRLAVRLAAGAMMAAVTISGAAAADRINVAIGHKGLWNSMVTVQCVHWGICEKAGLDVHITWTAGGSETLQAAITGSADLALTNGTLGVLAAYARGAPIRIVSAESTGSHDVYWYVLASSPIKSLQDLKGATIAYSEPGSSSQLDEIELAKHFNADLKLVPMGGLPANLTAVMSHQVDIGHAVPPFGLDKVHDGKIRIIARGGDVPSLQKETVRVNVANLAFLKAHRDVARRFIHAYQKTIDWLYAHPDKSIKLFAEANHVDMQIAKEAVTYFPEQSMNTAHLVGLDLVNQQAVQMGKLDKPLTKQQLHDVVDMLTN